MRVRAGLIVLGMGALVASCSAQTISNVGGVAIPPTKFPTPVVEAIAAELSREVSDPYSLTYSEVRAGYSNGVFGVCGNINQKNDIGAYAGLAPFAIAVGRPKHGTKDLRAVVVIAPSDMNAADRFTMETSIAIQVPSCSHTGPIPTMSEFLERTQ